MAGKFPEDFYWGAATSAHQVEGGNINDWSEWERSNKRIESLRKQIKAKNFRSKFPAHLFDNCPTPADIESYTSGKACDHYSRFREDFDIAQDLGHNAHRFSIEWSRVEPEEGKFNTKEIDHYGGVIRALKERGMEPFVTLWHWPLPLWLRDKGGWKSDATVDYFERYVRKIVSGIGQEIKFWITLNEPNVYAYHSYLLGTWPPQERDPFSCLKVLKNLIEAHNKSFIAITGINPRAQVGIAQNLTWFEPYPNNFFNQLLKQGADEIWNFYFLDRIQQDFIGVNNYGRNRIKYGFGRNENWIVSDIGWEVYPEAIYQIIRETYRRYQKPIYITENGISDGRDVLREEFVRSSLAWVSRAIGEGVDVRGYFHWSLLDNFEWHYGFCQRFGLVEVDHRTQERKVRESALVYSKIIKGA